MRDAREVAREMSIALVDAHQAPLSGPELFEVVAMEIPILAPLIEADRRSVLEEAERAVCLLCAGGNEPADYPPDPKIKGSGPLSIHTVEYTFGSAAKEPCQAWPIRAIRRALLGAGRESD